MKKKRKKITQKSNKITQQFAVHSTKQKDWFFDNSWQNCVRVLQTFARLGRKIYVQRLANSRLNIVHWCLDFLGRNWGNCFAISWQGQAVQSLYELDKRYLFNDYWYFEFLGKVGQGVLSSKALTTDGWAVVRFGVKHLYLLWDIFVGHCTTNLHRR
jgi:hypothetical protein